MARTSWLTLAEEDGRRFDALLAAPREERAPGLVVLHDMFGIGPPFRALAEEQAAKGRLVLVPNQFWRSQPSGPLSYDDAHHSAWARLEAFDWDQAVRGLRVSIDALRRMPGCNGKVAVLGFCFSGRLAFLAASRTDADAAAAFYSLGISRNIGEAARIACPLQLHYGTADEHVPMSEVDAVAAGIAGNAKIALHRYEGAGHSFFNPVRPTFDKAASALAAQRLDALMAGMA